MTLFSQWFKEFISLYSVYFLLDPFTRSAGYFLPFKAIFATTSFGRSTWHFSASLTKYTSTSLSSWARCCFSLGDQSVWKKDKIYYFHIQLGQKWQESSAISRTQAESTPYMASAIFHFNYCLDHRLVENKSLEW